MSSTALRFALTILFVFQAVLVAYAQPPAAPAPSPSAPTVEPTSFTPIYIDSTATVSDEAIQQALDGLARQESNPQHVVVLIHGFATTRNESAVQYNAIGAKVKADLAKHGQRVAVLGLQWDSDVGPPGVWVIRVVKAVVGLSDDNPYLKKVTMAANVGRVGARQVLIKLHERFPAARIDLLAHSLGANVVRHVVAPWHISSKVRKGDPPALAGFRPEVQIPLNLVCLAGADLDYDLFVRHKDEAHHKIPVTLFWLTVAGVKDLDQHDLALSLRAIARGDRAMGNQLPKLTPDQIQEFCSKRRLVYDGQDIPTNHVINRYYDDKRLSRLMEAAVTAADGGQASPLLATLEQIINAPGDPKVLQKFFDNTDLSVQFYTLWRLENIVCGGPQHLSDGYLEWLSHEMRDFPDEVDNQRWRGSCLVVRNGWWPTTAMMNMYFEALPGVEGRPKPVDDPYRLP